MVLEMNPNYIQGLSPQQRLLQLRLIKKSQKKYEDTGEIVERPKVSDKKTPRSSWVKQFEQKHGFPITDLAKVKKAYPNADIQTILKKGAGAYASSGSRPNVSSYQWKFARLASALLGGPAAKVDKDLL
jgi:hypothetical protein